jgi:uncharacterized protein (UPF0335 family)
MAFVKITKAGKGILSIPSGSLESYINNGWKPLDDSNKDSGAKTVNHKVEEEKPQNEDSGASETNASDEWDQVEAEEKEKKSLDEMTIEELQEKAKSLGLNIKNLNTVGALRKAIRRNE